MQSHLNVKMATLTLIISLKSRHLLSPLNNNTSIPPSPTPKTLSLSHPAIKYPSLFGHLTHSTHNFSPAKLSYQPRKEYSLNLYLLKSTLALITTSFLKATLKSLSTPHSILNSHSLKKLSTHLLEKIQPLHS